MAKYKMHVLICGGTGCKSSDSLDIIENFHTILKEKNLQDEVQVIKTGCFGFCEKGPIVKIMPDNTFYTQVKPEDVRRIVEEHLIKGRKVPELLYMNPENRSTCQTRNTWTSTRNRSVLPCATAVLWIPKILKSASPAVVMRHWQSASLR